MRLIEINSGSEFPRLKANSVLIDNGGLFILVDCGERSNADMILRNMSNNGISISRVELLLLTHLHFDHCENIDLFHKAMLIINWREIEFLERLCNIKTEDELRAEIKFHYGYIQSFFVRMICRRLRDNHEKYKRLIKDHGRLFIVEGDLSIADNLMIIDTCGHTPGHMSALVLSERPIWIAGDAIISLRSWKDKDRIKQQICWDMDQYLESSIRIATNGGVVIPGHGHPFELESLSPVSFKELEE